jgi:hypothetical protein
MTKKVPFGLTALVLLHGVTGQAQADYILTTFDPPGLTFTSAYGINDSGQIVGGMRMPPAWSTASSPRPPPSPNPRRFCCWASVPSA